MTGLKVHETEINPFNGLYFAGDPTRGGSQETNQDRFVSLFQILCDAFTDDLLDLPPVLNMRENIDSQSFVRSRIFYGRL